MKHPKIIATVALSILCLISACSSHKRAILISPTTPEKKQMEYSWRNDTLFDTAWYDMHMADKESIKKAVKNSGITNSFKKEMYGNAYYLLEKKEDFDSCDIITTEVFKMSEASLKNISSVDSNTSIESLLTFDKNLVVFFIAKDERIYYVYHFRRMNDYWTGILQGPVFKTVSDSLSKVIYEEKRKVFNVFIPNEYGKFFTVFKQNGEIMGNEKDGSRKNFLDKLKSIRPIDR